MLADPQPAELGVRRLGYNEWARADSPRVAVMKDQNLVVACEAHVAFDASARFQSCGKGDQAVLGKLRAKVQPTVRETRGAWIERVRP